MTYIKLTREDGTTRKGMRWDVGVTNRATGAGNRLCSDGVLHVYDTPEQAAFMRFAHCDSYTRAWEVESEDEGVTDGTKRGSKSCTVVQEIQLPKITTEQRVEIAVRASLLVYADAAYAEWANKWLSGEDRTAKAAYAAAEAASHAANAAYAAHAAANAAAYSVANTAYAVNAAHAASISAYAAARAADNAAYAAGHVDLQSIIKEVLG